jgi:hypothetical protein
MEGNRMQNECRSGWFGEGENVRESDLGQCKWKIRGKSMEVGKNSVEIVSCGNEEC